MVQDVDPIALRSEHAHLVSSIIGNHLKPKLGNLRLQQLTPLHVEHYYAQCQEQGLCDRTVALHHTILSGSLKAAVRQKLLRENVASMAMNKPRMSVRSSAGVLANVWTADEARRFLNTLKQEGNAQSTALFALALDTGMRKGELLGLMWKDLDGNVLQVERQLLGREEDEDGVLHLKTSLPKTHEARSVKVSEVTISLLREHKRVQAEVKLKDRPRYTDHGLMFAQDWEHKTSKNFRLGAPLFKNTITSTLDRVCRASGVRRSRPTGYATRTRR